MCVWSFKPEREKEPRGPTIEQRGAIPQRQEAPILQPTAEMSNKTWSTVVIVIIIPDGGIGCVV